MKIVTLLEGVFPEYLFEVSHLVFFGQKKSKQYDLPSIKTVTSCENYRSIIRGFL